MMIQFYADLSYSYFDTLIHTLIDFSYFFLLLLQRLLLRLLLVVAGCDA